PIGACVDNLCHVNAVCEIYDLPKDEREEIEESPKTSPLLSSSASSSLKKGRSAEAFTAEIEEKREKRETLTAPPPTSPTRSTSILDRDIIENYPHSSERLEKEREKRKEKEEEERLHLSEERKRRGRILHERERDFSLHVKKTFPRKASETEGEKGGEEEDSPSSSSSSSPAITSTIWLSPNGSYRC
ncbi:hypothetical protein CSUI_001551, partial [Cystoisospora suis]